MNDMFIDDLKDLGFEQVNDVDTALILKKRYEKKVQVAFYGEMDSIYEVEVNVSKISNKASAYFYKNGRLVKDKTYLQNSKGIRAIKDTIQIAGF